MVLMFSGLLSLSLLGVVVPVGFCAELALPWASPHHVLIAGAHTSAKTVFVRAAAENADGERDCIDENDTSDESSSSRQRTEEFGGSMSRYALGLFRAKLEHTTEAPRDTSLPLFYAFCRLLL